MSLVGVQALDGLEPTRALATPMITLNVICEMRQYGDSSLYAAEAQACLPQIMRHVHSDLQLVLETVGPAGGCVCARA